MSIIIVIYILFSPNWSLNNNTNNEQISLLYPYSVSFLSHETISLLSESTPTTISMWIIFPLLYIIQLLYSQFFYGSLFQLFFTANRKGEKQQFLFTCSTLMPFSDFSTENYCYVYEFMRGGWTEKIVVHGYFGSRQILRSIWVQYMFNKAEPFGHLSNFNSD